MQSDKNSSDIDNAAADWVARLDGAPLSPAENRIFQDWLIADPRHFGAYARAEAVLTRIALAGASFADDTSAAQPAAASIPVSRRWIIGSAAATVLLGAGALSYSYLSLTRYQTRRGEVRSISMADGSVITLNTSSIIDVRYTPFKRDVRLLEGEALFDVAKDPKRPFVVSAGDTDVHAVGTSFAVRRLEAKPMEVLVREGIVEITGTNGTPPLRAPANTRTVVANTPGGKAVTVGIDADAVMRELSWREGMIGFEGISLAQAALEFQRYNDTHILIDDPDVAALQITGLFSAYNPSGFAHAAADTFGLQVGTTPAGQITLRK